MRCFLPSRARANRPGCDIGTRGCTSQGGDPQEGAPLELEGAPQREGMATLTHDFRRAWGPVRVEEDPRLAHLALVTIVQRAAVANAPPPGR